LLAVAGMLGEVFLRWQLWSLLELLWLSLRRKGVAALSTVGNGVVDETEPERRGHGARFGRVGRFHVLHVLLALFEVKGRCRRKLRL